jgi:hypothetical protein
MIVSTIGSEKSSSSGACNYRDFKNKQRSNNYADQKAAVAKALAKQQHARLQANMLAASQIGLNTIDNTTNIIGDGDQQSLQSIAHQRRHQILRNNSTDVINNLQFNIQDESAKFQQKSFAKRLKQQISSTFCRAIKSFKSDNQGNNS